MHGDFSCSCSQAGFGGKDRSSRHSVRAGYEECVPHASFMSKVVTGSHDAPYVVFLQDAIPAVGVLYVFGRQADVQHLEPSQIFLVVRHQQCQREVGFQDIGRYVVGVVLAYQSRWNVDADHFGWR